eukprot:TRINITY_DN10849_c1_g1_i1.p1 TRINITY_DN10849_c1_g1~~TRINITY_DN10849_c1_g1_i1.p1  ORF type:complete len:1249 (+),score=243.17 TRINITY_DN10849_c1_g1_i1:516-3749(+)
MIKQLNENTTGLTPPGWSAPLLIDISAVAPLSGAAIGQQEAEEGMKSAKKQRSSCRNNETFITRVNEEAEAIARGELSAARRAKHEREQGKVTNTSHMVFDPTMDDEVLNFDFSTIQQDEDKAQVRRCWSSTTPVDVTDFKKLIPFPAVQYPFELDTFQKEAIYHIEANENVFVAAHTSAGKTVVAEYAIGLSMKRGSKVIYTSPIKTLSNQKFRDFTEKFEDVGIMTGDVQLKTGASCLIMTTEILRSMLYLDASFTNDVEYIVFDEVHYVSDPERGYVWEEIIILLPKNIRLIMLSATVPNVEVFADWVGRTRGSTVHVVGTLKRPVPLKHSLYYDKKEYPLVEVGKTHFDSMSYKAVHSLHEKKSQNKHLSYKAKMANEAREWRELIRYLQKEKRLPAIIFAFSKNKLDSIADKLGAMSFTTKSEKAAIEAFVRQAMSRLKGSDKSIPQVTKIFTLLKRGMAVHHAGLLPIIKEVVEVLFCKGLIRVLFATATFAMGVNAPAKCVVFAQTQKMDDSGKKDLKPGEYIQMSGRAGRRGLDTVGHVMIANIGEFPTEHSLKAMITGSPVELVSSFRITYSMILNNLLSPFAGISYIMRHSFAEARTNKYHPVYCALRDKYLDIQERDETDTSENATAMYQLVKTWVDGRKFLTGRTFESAAAASKFLTPGRLVVLEIAPMVLTLGYIVKTSPNDLTCMILMCEPTNRLYNPLRCGIPDTVASAPLEEVTIRKDKLIAVLMKSVVETPDFSMPKDKKGAVDKRKGVSLVMPKPGGMTFNPHDKKCLQETGEKMRAEFSSVELKDVLPSAATDIVSVDCQSEVKAAIEKATQIREGSYSHDDMNKAHRTADTKRLVNLYSKLADDDGLYLMPDYRGRLEVMAKLQLIEGTDDKHYDFRVSTKGRCAACISSMDSIVAVEMIFEGILDTLEPPLIAAVLSAFICSNKVFDNQKEAPLPPELQKVEDTLIDLITKLWKVQTAIFEVPDLDTYISKVINFSIAEAVWEWAHGTPFLSILDSTTAREGTLIRDITRLYGLCREFKNAAMALGDTALHAKISEASDLIKRDVVFCTSLYLDPA